MTSACPAKRAKRQSVSNIRNRPFPSFPGPLYQNEVKYSAFEMEMIFHSDAKLIFIRKVVHLGAF